MLQAFAQLVDVVPEDQLTQVLLPALLKKAEDPVPNVRFNVSKVLQVCIRMTPTLHTASLHTALRPPIVFCEHCLHHPSSRE
jgi:hypothetical protein